MVMTIEELQARKNCSARITMLTCYDATFARLLDEAEIDCILVGDSLGMVVKGEDNTLGVSVDEVAYHVAAVARGTQRAHIIGDMPFMSHQTGERDALMNAAKMIRAGAHSVKLEGGAEIAGPVRALVHAGIPVMGHVGLRPQSMHAQSGFRVQGRDPDSRQRIMNDALALEEAGVYALVLEGLPADLAVEITGALSIPTIGIGAGVGCDGQVLVLYDLLGLNPNFTPKFVKAYLPGAQLIHEAVSEYVKEVRNGHFPGLEHTFGVREKPNENQDQSKRRDKPVYGPTGDTVREAS
jgi:3-methyl-2-oxobutanoate hydroxymethyltransferase